jgi:hypothetical protein
VSEERIEKGNNPIPPRKQGGGGHERANNPIPPKPKAPPAKKK